MYLQPLDPRMIIFLGLVLEGSTWMVGSKLYSKVSPQEKRQNTEKNFQIWGHVTQIPPKKKTQSRTWIVTTTDRLEDPWDSKVGIGMEFDWVLANTGDKELNL